MARLEELDAITGERDEARRRFEELRKQRLDQFMTGFSTITYKLKEMYQVRGGGGEGRREKGRRKGRGGEGERREREGKRKSRRGKERGGEGLCDSVSYLSNPGLGQFCVSICLLLSPLSPSSSDDHPRRRR